MNNQVWLHYIGYYIPRDYNLRGEKYTLMFHWGKISHTLTLGKWQGRQAHRSVGTIFVNNQWYGTLTENKSWVAKFKDNQARSQGGAGGARQPPIFL